MKFYQVKMVTVFGTFVMGEYKNKKNAEEAAGLLKNTRPNIKIVDIEK